MKFFNHLTLRQKLGITLALPILCSLYLLFSQLMQSQQLQHNLVDDQSLQQLHHQAQHLSLQLQANTEQGVQTQAEAATLAKALQQSINDLRHTSNLRLISVITITMATCLISIFLFVYLFRTVELNFRSMTRSSHKLAQILGVNVKVSGMAGDELDQLNQYLINVVRHAHIAAIETDEERTDTENSHEQTTPQNTATPATSTPPQSASQEQLLLTVKAKMENLRDELSQVNHNIKELDDRSKAEVILDMIQRVSEQSDLMALNLTAETSKNSLSSAIKVGNDNAVTPSQQASPQPRYCTDNVVALKLNEKTDKDKS